MMEMLLASKRNEERLLGFPRTTRAVGDLEYKRLPPWDFPGGPVAKTPHSRRSTSNPWSRTRSHMLQLKMPHAAMKTEGTMCHN